MTPVLSVSLIWLFTMLAAVAHMAAGRRNLSGFAGAVGVYAVTFAAAAFVSPQPNWVGVLIGIAAFWRLIAGPMARTGPIIAGSSAALAAALQMMGGLSLSIAAPLGFAALFGARLVVGHTSDGRTAIREDVLIVAALATPVVGLAADFAYGWQSAALLNREAEQVGALMPPIWTIAILTLALTAGVIKGLWARR